MKNSDESNRIVDDDKEWVERWAKNFYADDQCSPPAQIVKYEDLLENTWGWKRLVPLPSLVEMPFYREYLEKYYQRNSRNDVGAEKTIQDWLLKPGVDQIATNGSGCGNYLSAAAKCCIEMEDKLMSALHTQLEHMTSTIVLSHMIKERAHLLISRKDEYSEVAMAAFVCIGKEAELMCQMLKLNAGPRDIYLSDLIRMCALSLMNYRGRTSIASAGAMVGIANEADLMCEWLRKDNELIVYRDPSLPQYIFNGKIIRATAFDLMVSIVEDSSCEIARDGNGAGIAVAEEAKSKSSRKDTSSDKALLEGTEARIPSSAPTGGISHSNVTDVTNRDTHVVHDHAEEEDSEPTSLASKMKGMLNKARELHVKQQKEHKDKIDDMQNMHKRHESEFSEVLAEMQSLVEGASSSGGNGQGPPKRRRDEAS